MPAPLRIMRFNSYRARIRFGHSVGLRLRPADGSKKNISMGILSCYPSTLLMWPPVVNREDIRIGGRQAMGFYPTAHEYFSRLSSSDLDNAERAIDFTTQGGF